MDYKHLAEIYGSQNGPEAGPWNLSLTQKYLEYRFAKFFEENFPVPAGAQVCNVGIGAGYWDRYLSYHLNGGRLTSIDINEEICRDFAACLENEGNPNPVEILARDVMDCDFPGRFHLVTMVGSTRLETGLFAPVMERLFRFARPGGAVYYQSLDPAEEKSAVEALCAKNGMRAERYEFDGSYGCSAHYWKLTKPAAEGSDR